MKSSACRPAVKLRYSTTFWLPQFVVLYCNTRGNLSCHYPDILYNAEYTCVCYCGIQLSVDQSTKQRRKLAIDWGAQSCGCVWRALNWSKLSFSRFVLYCIVLYCIVFLVSNFSGINWIALSRNIQRHTSLSPLHFHLARQRIMCRDILVSLHFT